VRAVAGHGCTFVRGPPGYALSPGGRATRPSPTERERRGLCGQWHTTHVRDTRAHWVPAPRRPMAGRGDAGRWSGRRRPARMSTALGPVPAWLSPRWRRRSGCPRVSSGHARSRGSCARAAEPARRRRRRRSGRGNRGGSRTTTRVGNGLIADVARVTETASTSRPLWRRNVGAWRALPRGHRTRGYGTLSGLGGILSFVATPLGPWSGSGTDLVRNRIIGGPVPLSGTGTWGR
jgi:hypothetical protein